MTMTAILESNRFTTPQFSQGIVKNKPESIPCDLGHAARERFLAQHGPAAVLPRGPVISKESRKALRAAEMARWACYHAGLATS